MIAAKAKWGRGDTVRAVVAGLFGLVLGLATFALLFSDLAPGETLLSRYLTSVAANLVIGLVIGALNPKAWWLGGVVAWGGILIALKALFFGPQAWGEALTTIGISPGPAFAGGYLGALLARKVFRRWKAG